MNRHTWMDASTGSRYMKKFDAIRFCAGRNSQSDHMIIEVVDTTFDNETQRVAYHLGKVLQVDVKR